MSQVASVNVRSKAIMFLSLAHGGQTRPERAQTSVYAQNRAYTGQIKLSSLKDWFALHAPTRNYNMPMK